MQGIRLRTQVPRECATDGLPAGIYIAGGEKLHVR